MEKSTCLSPTSWNPYRYEIYDKMRVRVGVHTAVATDMRFVFSEAFEGDRRVGVRCRPLRHGPMTSSFDQLWRAMQSCLSRPADSDGRVLEEGWQHGKVDAT